MNTTVSDLMREARNYFPTAAVDGEFTLAGGALTPSPGLTPGGYVALTGATLCSGVYRVDAQGLLPGAPDETFRGRVWLLAPPEGFLRLAEEITRWREAQPTGGVVKESFGAYSRSMGQSQRGAAVSWQTAFADAIRPWRRMHTEVSC